MSTFKASQVFASIPQTAENKTPLTFNAGRERVSPPDGDKEIKVSATGQVDLSPDRCRITISVKSTKDQVQDAKNSVSRRVEYILQTLANHHVKDENIERSKTLKRIDSSYFYCIEISVSSASLSDCQSISNFLVEKLGDNIQITPPDLTHGPQRLESARRQATLSATRQARQKATEIAQFIHAKVGAPVAIHEECCNEWFGLADGPLEVDGPLTMQQRIDHATFHATAKVSATFVLKPKRSKENKT